MSSAKNITSLARKWQKMAAMRKRTISLPRTYKEADIDGSNNSTVAHKGHFVVYTTDQKRFELPLTYLNNIIFQELLKLSEDEFGLSSDGPITLPCDAVFLHYIVSLIKRGVAKGFEKHFVNSITTDFYKFSATFTREHTEQQSLVCSY